MKLVDVEVSVANHLCCNSDETSSCQLQDQILPSAGPFGFRHVAVGVWFGVQVREFGHYGLECS